MVEVVGERFGWPTAVAFEDGECGLEAGVECFSALTESNPVGFGLSRRRGCLGGCSLCCDEVFGEPEFEATGRFDSPAVGVALSRRDGSGFVELKALSEMYEACGVGGGEATCDGVGGDVSDPEPG